MGGIDGACWEDDASMTVDLAWRDAVRDACEPVFASADVGFVWNKSNFVADRPTLLWEADPKRFSARYPDSGIEHSYGDQWPPPCIDYWVYIDPAAMVARLSVEGWNGRDQTVDLSGYGFSDGQLLATSFAAILGVPPPDEE
jgi:hypothetical protein